MTDEQVNAAKDAGTKEFWLGYRDSVLKKKEGDAPYLWGTTECNAWLAGRRLAEKDRGEDVDDDNGWKSFWKSKTLWAGIITVIIGGICLIVDSYSDVDSPVGTKIRDVGIMVTGFLFMGLRKLTNQPISPILNFTPKQGDNLMLKRQ